jgi:hypothetical protein
VTVGLNKSRARQNQPGWCPEGHERNRGRLRFFRSHYPPLATHPPRPPLPVHNMKDQTPCSDYLETSGIVFFARMLDKIRLNARGLLPDGYNLGFSDPTCFDARFCRFWDIDYDQLAARQKTSEFGPNPGLEFFYYQAGLARRRCARTDRRKRVEWMRSPRRHPDLRRFARRRRRPHPEIL